MTCEQIMQIEAKLNYTFKNKQLLVRAFTHSSFANAKCDGNALLNSNERSAFFGDSILGMIVSQYLYEVYPDSSKGDMTYMRSRIVSSETLAPVVRELNLVNHLQIMTDSEPSDHLCGDLFEAIVCAIYLDGGFAMAQKFIISLLDNALAAANKVTYKDSKTLLQEHCQRLKTQNGKKGVKIEYKSVQLGSANKPIHKCDLFIDDKYMCSGEGGTKAKAEQDAANKLVTKWRIDSALS